MPSFLHPALAQGGLGIPDFSYEMNLTMRTHSLLKTHPNVLLSCLLAQPKALGACVRGGYLLPQLFAVW